MQKISYLLAVIYFILIYGILIANEKFYNKNILPPYPLISSNVKKYKKIPRDNNGIPFLNFFGRRIYYPIQYLQIALTYYNHYYFYHDKNSLKNFLKLAKFMLKHFEIKGNIGGVYTYDALKEWNYKLPKKWLSAMSQGFALGVAIRAFKLTKNKKYLKIIPFILNSFKTPIEFGGVLSIWNGEYFYEEYPALQKPHVLNGFIFSLAGLYDLYLNTGNTEAKKLFFLGIKSLKRNLRYYDAGFTSFYSMLKNKYGIKAVASAIGNPPDHYHHLHIAQLLYLYLITKDKFFLKWAEKFLEYDMGAMEDYGMPNKFEEIYANFTIEPKKYGVKNLIDSNWTYGYYWSSNKFPVEIRIKPRRIISNFNGFMFVSISKETAPKKFKVFVKTINNRWLEVAKFHLSKTFYYKTRHYESYVYVYKIDNQNIKREKILEVKFIFYKPKGKILALREINLFYSMYPELKNLILMLKKEWGIH